MDDLPFSRTIEVDAVPPEGLTITIEAGAAEREALAAHCGVEAVPALRATFEIRPRGAGTWVVDGTLAARVTQICGVTLEPFDSPVEDEFSVDFSDRPASPPPAGELVASEAVEPPDPVVDGRIDLGALATEFLVLGIDPYPRKPGASFEESPRDPAENPFSVLSRLGGRPE